MPQFFFFSGDRGIVFPFETSSGGDQLFHLGSPDCRRCFCAVFFFGGGGSKIGGGDQNDICFFFRRGEMLMMFFFSRGRC